MLLHQSTIASCSRYRSKCAAGCALIRGRQLKPPSELERVVTPEAGRGGKEGRRGRRRDAKRLSPWFCYSLLTWTPLVDANVNWGSTGLQACDGCLRNEAAVPQWNGGRKRGGEGRSGLKEPVKFWLTNGRDWTCDEK